jgi:DNA-binding NarL/FixJ family response regulator
MTTTIAFIDDNTDMLSIIENYYATQSEYVISVYSSIEAFLAQKDATFDILFLDIVLPTISGLDALPNIKALYPQTEIIMFTIQEDADSLFRAFLNGASGYLLKDFSMSSLNDYIKIIKNGGSAISAKMAQYLIKNIDTSSKSLEILNDKEYQILELLAEGWSYKLIADRACLSIDGVRFYIKRIYKALNINSKGEALRIYYKNKI